LATEKQGSVDYCLVNNQYIKSQAQKNSLWYTMGQPDKLADRWLKAAEQQTKYDIRYY
jgi:hypothetical protein